MAENKAWNDWNDSHLDTALHNTPINILRDGYYGFNSGNTIYPSILGYYWSSKTIPDGNSIFILMFRITRLNSQVDHTKGDGLPLRCLVR